MIASNTNRNGLWYEKEVAKQIVSKKYMHEDEKEFIEFVNRVGSIYDEQTSEDIRECMINADFFLAGRSLYGAGSVGKFKATMSNCYILPMPEDNLESIYDIKKQMARIFSYGGGCGVNISNLRPKGAKVNNAARTSTGACSFMKEFDVTGQVIGANNRRAALIIGMNCDHPDIEEFLDIKRNNTEIQSANISILFNDDFMLAVRDNKPYTLSFTVKETGETITKEINARDFFMKFAEAQWDWAEPGALFIDRIRNYNLLSGYPQDQYKIDISNPCAEYTGEAGNACTLGSINLYNVVLNPFTINAVINYGKLRELVITGVRALDEVLDYGYDTQPLDMNRDSINKWRAIGLGIFGLADMLITLGVRYGSNRSMEIVEEVMEFIFFHAINESCILAEEKGAFDMFNWDYIKESPMIKLVKTKNLMLYKQIEEYGLRNGSLISVAPTGTISTMCGLSGGAEPLFAISYERTTHALSNENKTFKVYAKSVEDLLIHDGYNPEEVDIEWIQKKYPYVVASHDVSPLDRVHVQARMQQYVDNAISSTVNLKNTATVQDVFNAYLEAWHFGCKGLTVFRDGCSRTSILKSVTSQPEQKEEVFEIKPDSILPISAKSYDRLESARYHKSTACVPNLYVHTAHLGDNMLEVFTSSQHGCKSNLGTITRLASLALRCGVKVEKVIEELSSNTCLACINAKKKDLSCGHAVANAIRAEYDRIKGVKTEIDCKPSGADCFICSKSEVCHGSSVKKDTAFDVELEKKRKYLQCPECKQYTLIPEGKCATCVNCLYNKCE